MSVQNQATFNSYTANGATTVFPFTFLLLEAGDLVVELAGVVQSTGFTVSGIGVSGGGDVTFTVAPANGVKVLLKRVLTLQRLTDYQNNGDLLAATLNKDFDRIWQSLQQLQQNDIRALKLPFDTPTDQVIPEDAATRANRGIKFDASGNLILADYDPDAAQTDSAVAAASAAASAAAASSSEGNAAASASAAAASAAAASASATQAENTPVAAPTHAAAGKAAPVDADELPLVDSAASWALKKLTWENIKATLKTYFDTIYSTLFAASTADAQAGTDNTKAITPLSLREGFRAGGSAPVYACRAWVNFNGTGTVAIRASGNVSSITDNGTGDYTINFTEPMPDVDFSCVASGGFNDPSFNVHATLGSSRTTSSVRVLGASVTATANAFSDLQNCNVAIFR